MEPLEAFLGSTMRLKPEDAVAALLQLADGRYVMQLRDSKPGIFYPGHWGCFGGAVDPGEAPLSAIRRELAEEIGLTLSDADIAYFTQFHFDFAFAGHGLRSRIYYSIVLADNDIDRFVLTEGCGIAASHGRNLLANERIVPYDAFAVWMHDNQDRFRGDRPSVGAPFQEPSSCAP